jgi:hypothetical protein
VPSVGLGEIVVLCDECRLVPEGQFGLVGYADPCVRYDFYVPWGIGDLSENLRLVPLDNG